MKRLVPLFAALVLGLLAVEMGLRLAQRVRYGTPVLSLLPGYRDARFQLSPFLVFGPRLGWQIPGKPVPELAVFNEQGFRHHGPLPTREPGEIRVLALGGSTTENVWNEAGIHWPLVAQCLLRERGYRIRIFNGAMSAYSSAHSLVRLQFDAVEHDPDMLVVMHAVNDLVVNYTAFARGRDVDPNYLVRYGTRGFTGELGPEDIVLSRVLRAFTMRLAPSREAVIPPGLWPDTIEGGLRLFERNLRTLTGVARASGIDPVLVTMPYSREAVHYATLADAGDGGVGLGRLPEPGRFWRDMDRYNEATRTQAARLDVPLVDMASLLVAEPNDFVDPVHYSTVGILHFAEAFADGLIPLLPAPDSGYQPSEVRECGLLTQALETVH